MEVYVAGKTDDWRRVRRVQEACVRMGHTITFDWTRVIEREGTDAGLDPEQKDFRQACAIHDQVGVEKADLFIMCCHPGLCGTLIEFGMAAMRRIPIIVLGEPERNSVFFELPGVTMAPLDTDLIQLLQDAKERHALQL